MILSILKTSGNSEKSEKSVSSPIMATEEVVLRFSVKKVA